MTTEEIRKQLSDERKRQEIRFLFDSPDDLWERYEQAKLLTDSKALSEFEQEYQTLQRSLNRQKKYLSLLRKKLLSSK